MKLSAYQIVKDLYDHGVVMGDGDLVVVAKQRFLDSLQQLKMTENEDLPLNDIDDEALVERLAFSSSNAATPSSSADDTSLSKAESANSLAQSANDKATSSSEDAALTEAQQRLLAANFLTDNSDFQRYDDGSIHHHDTDRPLTAGEVIDQYQAQQLASQTPKMQAEVAATLKALTLVKSDTPVRVTQAAVKEAHRPEYKRGENRFGNAGKPGASTDNSDAMVQAAGTPRFGTANDDKPADSNTTDSNTTDSNTTDSNTTDSNTTDSNTTDSNTTD